MAAAELAAVDSALDSLLAAALRDGLLDDQFTQLMQLQDESTPDFVAEMVQLYFEDSAGKLDRLGELLAPAAAGGAGAGAVDYAALDALAHQLKGSSASFGAAAAAAACARLREAGAARDAGGCGAAAVALRAGHAALRARLEEFSALEARRKALAGAGAGAGAGR